MLRAHSRVQRRIESLIAPTLGTLNRSSGEPGKGATGQSALNDPLKGECSQSACHDEIRSMPVGSKVVGPYETESSQKPIPVHTLVANALMSWRKVEDGVCGERRGARTAGLVARPFLTWL
jgi:hypothetical protein